VKNCGIRSLVMKNGNLTRLITHSPTFRVFTDQNKLFIDQNKLFTDQNKLFTDQNKLFNDQNKLFTDQNKLFTDQNKLFTYIEMLTGLNFVHASYFSYCGLQGYKTVYSEKYQCSTLKIKAAVFLQPVSNVLPEHTLSNPEGYNTNIQNESLNSLVMFVLIHNWML